MPPRQQRDTRTSTTELAGLRHPGDKSYARFVPDSNAQGHQLGHALSMGRPGCLRTTFRRTESSHDCLETVCDICVTNPIAPSGQSRSDPLDGRRHCCVGDRGGPADCAMTSSGLSSVVAGFRFPREVDLGSRSAGTCGTACPTAT
jgi:hypothetical protein